jgi:hypothetical protein
MSGAKPTLSYVPSCCTQKKKLYINYGGTIYIIFCLVTTNDLIIIGIMSCLLPVFFFLALQPIVGLYFAAL